MMASNLQSQGQSQTNVNSQSGYEVSLTMLMVYNPTLQPPNKKPSEEDIQDAKLIFYYPENTVIEERRNHVGLAEGNFQFWSSFINEDTSNEDDAEVSEISKGIDLLADEPLSSSSSTTASTSVNPSVPAKKKFVAKKNVQITTMDKYIHVQEEVEEDIWIYMVLQKNAASVINLSVRREDEAEYYSSETNRFEESRLKDDHALLILRHFYETLRMFFGDMRESIAAGSKEFTALMNTFILRYLDLNGDPANKRLNALRYEFMGFQYAQIEKNTFLSLQSLLNIISTIDSAVKHSLIFFAGNFIYSSLNHDSAVSIYEYFFSTEKPFSYSDKKLQRFSFMQSVETSHFYGSICNSHRAGLKSNDGSGSKAFPLQKIFVKSADSSSSCTRNEEYQMNVFYEKSLMVVMLYESNQVVEVDKVADINSAIAKNSEKIAARVDASIQEYLKKEEGYKYLYFNQMNIATKISNPITLNHFLREEVDTISAIYHELAMSTQNYASQQHLTKSTNVWIYGYKNLSRIVIMLFPGTLTLPKVFEESEKLFKNYFPLLYM